MATAAAIDDSDDEWEYEYDPTETESFYLNLDLTSYHGPVRPPRQRQGAQDKDQAPQNDAGDDPDLDAFTPLESAETNSVGRERIQILGLHTCNPIVSYLNQMFSCSWADQIGTELLFSHPDTDPDKDPACPTPLVQGPAFELLAANSVKLLGRKTRITASGAPGFVHDGSVPSSMQTTGPSSVPGRPTNLSNQAQFIRKLQELKQAKGETDTVRTTFSHQRNVNVARRLAAWARTEAQVAEIRRLNELAAHGNPDALAQLEELFRAYCDEDPSEQMYS
ncbi:hypothetical protein N7532_003359 [Penicillium argentinense]|uniref:Transcription factor TFIIIC triple barrel domain-containing protein n=1 Tax=Penicillium argentinense TaxID=1131581 RepID=A0A9W9FMW5_9EURO|nr:uncharacterized protein N7532_003359 [Penicillium argentinense]KAJ5102830.1 hypothetical protein N7532_003359 [Penicillium argentinense]